MQRDIVEQLHLRQPYVALSSFDRPNLRLVVLRKPAGGRGSAFEPLVKALTLKPSDNSTIIYAPTQKEVQVLADMLGESLRNVCAVLPYHAGLPPMDREAAHRGFLTGRVQVIVATVAFGMGIDKPDTRRVMHWGCPKTVEEYYQQVGRAGRDGLPGECTMFADFPDFARYRDDFYLSGLGTQAKAAALSSLEALQKMAMSETECRRRSLLRFFEETAAFGERCGNCDNCSNAKKYAGQSERDFGAPARVLLTALAGVKPCGMSVLDKLVKGAAVEDWRYNQGYNSGAKAAQEAVKRAREAPGAAAVPDPVRNLLPSLLEAGYITQQTMKAAFGSYAAYSLSHLGYSLVQDKSRAILLKVPEVVREVERIAEEKRQLAISKLTKNGVELASIPAAELKVGGGEVMDAYAHFYAHLENMRRSDPLKADALLQLKNDISAWRAATAQKLIMAPAAVLPEHLVCKLAYVASRGPLTEKALGDIGVRVLGTAELAEVTVRWCKQHGVAQTQTQTGAGGGHMVNLPVCFKPRAWDLAQYSAGKTWEGSVERFSHGESLAAIAINQGTLKGGGQKKPILVQTVANHLLDGLAYGRHNFDLRRLAMEYPTPSCDVWAALAQAEKELGIDVTTVASVPKADLLRNLCPAMSVPYAERSEEHKASHALWYPWLSWYICLRRSAYEPEFGGVGKRGPDQLTEEQKRQRVH